MGMGTLKTRRIELSLSDGPGIKMTDDRYPINGY